jgi:hypothetical protein
MPKLKIPFTVRLAEVRSYINADNRIAGWGVFLSGVLLASMVLYVWVRGWQIFPRLGLAFLLIAATTFANPYAWWARFAPQVALLPILLMVPALAIGSRKVKWAAALLCFLLLCDSVICAAGSTYRALSFTSAIKRQMGQMAQQCGPGDYWLYGEPLLHFEQLPEYRGVVIRTDPQTPETTPSPYSFRLGTLFPVAVHRSVCSLPPSHP